MAAFDEIIEERIRRAELRGDFENLPGTGKPLDFDDDLFVPVEMRAANRVLKNSGYVPAELIELNRFTLLATEVSMATGLESRRSGSRRLQCLLITLESRGLTLTARGILARYRDPLIEKLATR